MLRYAAVWLRNTEHNAANLQLLPYTDFNSSIHDFYTVVEVPNPDDDYE
jgi:hypothetical protein